MNMDCRVCALSVLTFIAIEISCVSSEPAKIDNDLAVGNPDNFLRSALLSHLDDIDDFEKRRSLMRFGKRGSLMRFGKRGSIMRFGKRSSLMRFGKKNNYDSDLAAYVPDQYFDSDEVNNDKRSSLMRFGKKSSIMRFGRSEAEKKPHVPWRFGKDLEDWEYDTE